MTILKAPIIWIAAVVVTVMLTAVTENAMAASAEEINIKVDAALDLFRKKVSGGDRF